MEQSGRVDRHRDGESLQGAAMSMADDAFIDELQEQIAALTAERDAALDLVRWAYGKLNILVFSRMDDALKLDEMKLLLMQESSDE